jgi:hypothetical protein
MNNLLGAMEAGDHRPNTTWTSNAVVITGRPPFRMPPFVGWALIGALVGVWLIVRSARV